MEFSMKNIGVKVLKKKVRKIIKQKQEINRKRKIKKKKKKKRGGGGGAINYELKPIHLESGEGREMNWRPYELTCQKGFTSVQKTSVKY